MPETVSTIAVTNLSKHFGGVVALDDLSFTVGDGELFGLIGPDGSGKTTILRTLAGILAPTSGSARILGKLTTESDSVREKVGYMSQRLGLYPDLTVVENLGFYADLYGVSGSERKPKMEELLSFSALGDFRQRRAGALSGGMRQKLALACTLVHTPRVLLLDEPTNGVDPVSRREFWRILHKLQQQGVSILVTTAYLDEADRCHRVGLMREGRLVACGRPEEVRNLFPGTVFEIRTTDTRRAVTLLRSRLPASSIHLFGDRIRLLVSDPHQSEQTLSQMTEGPDMAQMEITRASASLEDVFIWITSRRERGSDDGN